MNLLHSVDSLSVVFIHSFQLTHLFRPLFTVTPIFGALFSYLLEDKRYELG